MNPSPKESHHETAPEDRLPWTEKLGFALGYAGPGAFVGGLKTFIFVMELGVSPAVIGIIDFILSVIAAPVGPLLGQFGDNFRSRWGRRKPLMLMGGIPSVLILCALYAFPGGMSEKGLWLWLFLIPLLNMVPSSLYAQGLGGLSTEAIRDYHERVRLSVIISFAVAVLGFLAQALYPIAKNRIHPLVIPFGNTELVLLKFPVFADAVAGARWIIGWSAPLFLICVLLPLFLCPEKRYEQVKKIRTKNPFIPTIKEAFKNREFLIVFMIKTVAFFCYSIVGSMGMLMNTYLVYGGDKGLASSTYMFLGWSYIISQTASLFIYRLIEPKLGKQRVIRIAAGILMAGCLSKLVVYQPSMPWLQLIPLIANGASVTGLHLMTGSMFGDIIDYDELLHHKRREALFGSLFNWGEQKGISLAGLIGGFVLVWIGFNAKLTGPQGATTLHLMQFFYFLFPFCGALFAFVMIGRYKLTETRMYEIRDELKKRHAEKKAAEEAQALLADGAANAPA